jgi:5'-3' exonuclease
VAAEGRRIGVFVPPLRRFPPDVRVFLVDGTYELFRHHFGVPSHVTGDGREVAATRGVLGSMLNMLASGVTHIGVATDHVIESFRNELWPSYKSSAGMPRELLAQFPLLEEGLTALGVMVWPMVEVEADDALASAAAIAAADPAVEQVAICTPDKDLAQCVRGHRVVQVDRRTNVVTDEDGVFARYGVLPASIPDWLALVGDSADGFPGLPGWGKKSAATVLAHYGHLEAIPDAPGQWEVGVRNGGTLAATLAARRQEAMLFRVLATLLEDRPVMGDVEELRWQGPAPELAELAARMDAPSLVPRAQRLSERTPPATGG